MKKLLFLFIVISISMFSLYSQTKAIKGMVISEYFEILPAVTIMINDTVEVGRTDINGSFQIDIPIFEEKILFVFVGMEPTTIKLVDKCDNIEVVMMADFIYDFMTLKRVERKRKKRFKKLTEIHKQAYEKNIFKTEHACYNRKFESFYLQEY